MAFVNVTTWYLDYQGAAVVLPEWPAGVALTEAKIASPDLSQFLFCAVGTHWHWFSRLSWTYQQWLDYLTAGNVRTWVLYQEGTPAGFVELRKHEDNSVELKFFGLLPAFIGRGLGTRLAQAAIALAQQWQASRVWVHTCSEDHPSALKTYQQAGFVISQTEQQDEEMPSDYPTAALAANFVHSRMMYFAAKK
ncbi:acetyltransferase [Rheinheimera sp. SA_1]|jgi:GNAT superfamily N-acetyltransferase|uniref:GNAT family N-acetyltransferase n=1 Tax=Rheinheimera sp. SA_1 TaxID=1827365 RepID=UPI0007FC8924|nr:GNAT family N-acetyltransferase [Rheinheimera sp. SA_1]OBP14017.1 acetyltransferase [Rheinheimera sp. SA_1]